MYSVFYLLSHRQQEEGTTPDSVSSDKHRPCGLNETTHVLRRQQGFEPRPSLLRAHRFDNLATAPFHYMPCWVYYVHGLPIEYTPERRDLRLLVFLPKDAGKVGFFKVFAALTTVPLRRVMVRGYAAMGVWLSCLWLANSVSCVLELRCVIGESPVRVYCFVFRWCVLVEKGFAVTCHYYS